MDQIADMLTRIRNAQNIGLKEVTMPSSNFKMAVAKKLQSKNYLDEVGVSTEGNKSYLRLKLKYDNHERPAITGIEQVSHQGQRIYVGATDMLKVKNGYGVAVISTPKGILTGEEARKQKVGGEYICKIW